MTWLRQLLDWQQETADPGEFLESLRFEISGAEVFVFTPKGDVIALTAGADARRLCLCGSHRSGSPDGWRASQRPLVPLDSVLENGDVVEVLTSKAEGAGPSQDWVKFVKSARARNKIRSWFSKERREEAVENGKESIARAMRKQGLPIQRIMSGPALLAAATELRLKDITSLYAAVGEGQVSAQSVVRRLVEVLGGEEGATEDLAEATTATKPARVRTHGDPGVMVKGVDDVWVKLARCCTPVPGDGIVGFVTTRCRCLSAPLRLRERHRHGDTRFVDVEWAPTASSVFLVAIQVEALDRARLLSDVTRVLSDQHVNILNASVTTTRDRVALSRFTFEMGDTRHLGHVLSAVRGVEGVFDAYRITSN